MTSGCSIAWWHIRCSLKRVFYQAAAKTKFVLSSSRMLLWVHLWSHPPRTQAGLPWYPASQGQKTHPVKDIPSAVVQKQT